MSYSPPTGNTCNLYFSGAYTPPAGNAANLYFTGEQFNESFYAGMSMAAAFSKAVSPFGTFLIQMGMSASHAVAASVTKIAPYMTVTSTVTKATSAAKAAGITLAASLAARVQHYFTLAASAVMGAAKTVQVNATRAASAVASASFSRACARSYSAGILAAATFARQVNPIKAGSITLATATQNLVGVIRAAGITLATSFIYSAPQSIVLMASMVMSAVENAQAQVLKQAAATAGAALQNMVGAVRSAGIVFFAPSHLRAIDAVRSAGLAVISYEPANAITKGMATEITLATTCVAILVHLLTLTASAVLSAARTLQVSTARAAGVVVSATAFKQAGKVYSAGVTLGVTVARQAGTVRAAGIALATSALIGLAYFRTLTTAMILTTARIATLVAAIRAASAVMAASRGVALTRTLLVNLGLAVSRAVGGGPYSPPAGNAANLYFSQAGHYVPPAGNVVNLYFTNSTVISFLVKQVNAHRGAAAVLGTGMARQVNKIIAALMSMAASFSDIVYHGLANVYLNAAMILTPKPMVRKVFAIRPVSLVVATLRKAAIKRKMTDAMVLAASIAYTHIRPLHLACSMVVAYVSKMAQVNAIRKPTAAHGIVMKPKRGVTHLFAGRLAGMAMGPAPGSKRAITTHLPRASAVLSAVRIVIADKVLKAGILMAASIAHGRFYYEALSAAIMLNLNKAAKVEITRAAGVALSTLSTRIVNLKHVAGVALGAMAQRANMLAHSTGMVCNSIITRTYNSLKTVGISLGASPPVNFISTNLSTMHTILIEFFSAVPGPKIYGLLLEATINTNLAIQNALEVTRTAHMVLGTTFYRGFSKTYYTTLSMGAAAYKSFPKMFFVAISLGTTSKRFVASTQSAVLSMATGLGNFLFTRVLSAGVVLTLKYHISYFKAFYVTLMIRSRATLYATFNTGKISSKIRRLNIFTKLSRFNRFTTKERIDHE